MEQTRGEGGGGVRRNKGRRGEVLRLGVRRVKAEGDSVVGVCG